MQTCHWTSPSGKSYTCSGVHCVGCGSHFTRYREETICSECRSWNELRNHWWY